MKLHCCQSVGYGGHSSTRLMIKKRFLIFYLHYFYFIGEKLLLIQGKQKFFATLPANRFSPKKANMAATTYIFSMNQKTAFLGCAVEFSLYSLLFVFGAIKYLHVLLYRVNISRPTVWLLLSGLGTVSRHTALYTDVVAMIFLVVILKMMNFN
jgi:hypothetical protein